VAGALALADLAPAGALRASAGVRNLLPGSDVVLVPDGTVILPGLGATQVFRAIRG
jgi:hypothetical protein